MPTVSILMPVYNTEAYLREAMDSMLAQTFADFELIVLDDCSPDNADEILDTYSDPRIVRYRGEQNVGLANILNTGVDMARGRYIARMDSDDLSLPDRLASQVAYMERHPDTDLCSTAMQLFGERDGMWRRNGDPEEVKVEALFYSPVLHASSLWRREAFESKGLRFRQSTVPAEDYDLWTRALLAGLRMVNLPDALYRYRIHATQATSTTSSKEQQVREAYIRATLPTLSPRQVAHFPCGLIPILLANCRSRFYNPLRLAKRIVKVKCRASRS